MVLLRPHHPRICRGYLERAGAPERRWPTRARACAARGRETCFRRNRITFGIIEICLMAIILSVVAPPRHCEARAKQSIHLQADSMDCFVASLLAMTEMPREFMLTRTAAPFRRGHARHRRRQPLAGADQPGLLRLCRPVRRLHRRDHPARADRASATRGRSAGAHRQLLRADRGRRIRSRRPPGQGQPLLAALVRRAEPGRRRGRHACDRRICRAPSVMVASGGADAGGEAVRRRPALRQDRRALGQAI